MNRVVRDAIEESLDRDVRPGLSAHAGSIEVISASEDGVSLDFVGSCRSCYFRVSCAVNLVAPTVIEAVGGPVPVNIRGVSSAQLARLVPAAAAR